MRRKLPTLALLMALGALGACAAMLPDQPQTRPEQARGPGLDNGTELGLMHDSERTGHGSHGGEASSGFGSGPSSHHGSGPGPHR